MHIHIYMHIYVLKGILMQYMLYRTGCPTCEPAMLARPEVGYRTRELVARLDVAELSYTTTTTTTTTTTSYSGIRIKSLTCIS